MRRTWDARSSLSCSGLDDRCRRRAKGTRHRRDLCAFTFGDVFADGARLFSSAVVWGDTLAGGRSEALRSSAPGSTQTAHPHC